MTNRPTSVRDGVMVGRTGRKATGTQRHGGRAADREKKERAKTRKNKEHKEQKHAKSAKEFQEFLGDLCDVLFHPGEQNTTAKE